MGNGLIYVPGVFVCPKCKFKLYSKNLYMKSGTIGPKDSGDRESCPNCPAVMLEPLTWKEHAEEYENNSERSFKNGYLAGFRDGSEGKVFNEFWR